MKKQYETVITYGTFDMFHVGHLNLLVRLGDMADQVIVAVSTDEFNSQKGKRVLIPYEQRAAIVEAIDCVDLVIPEYSWEQKIDDIKNYRVDAFVIGDDWQGKFDELEEYCDVVYLPRTKDISTTALKKSLNSLLSVPKDDIIQALETLEMLRKDLE